MRRLLQSILYNRKVYDRPQDEWVCGRAAEGCPCLYGPGKNGECRATFQCLPAKKGDRWMCTRLISLGGACENGPLPDGTCCCPVPPCRPKRSLRGMRRRLTWLAVLGALGVSIFTLAGRDRAAWAIPGPLTSQHATSAQRCTDCHLEIPGVHLSPAARAQHIADHNLRCLQCHELGAHGSSPHGLDPQELARLTAEAKEKNAPIAQAILASARKLAPDAHTPLSCAACHAEHHGRDVDLKKMDSRQCQTCHQKQFDHFAQDHPEFTDYPYERRTRLRFDHATHWQKHFYEPQVAAVAPTSCTTCHEPAPDGRQMVVRGFDQTCARCHAGQIAGEGRAGDKGVAFFRLPAVDVATLQASGVAVGEYPAFAEGGLTPFMRWLLEGDPAAKQALAELDGVDLANLKTATSGQRAAAAQVIWSVKGLMADLATQGQEVLVRRLGMLAKNHPTLAGRTGQLSADSLAAAQQAWLPSLLTEVAAYRRGEKPALPKPAASGNEAPSATPRPAVAPAADPATPASDDLLAEDAPAKSAADAKPKVPIEDDLLAEDPLPAKKTESSAPVAIVPNASAPVPAAAASLPFAEGEQRVAQGGWYRRDDSYTLYYRPSGHEDAFLATWLDATVRDPEPATQAIFAQLGDREAPGLCLKCHTVDDTPRGTLVNWRTRQPNAAEHPFTKFKHTVHFSLIGDQGCMTCHVLDPNHAYPTSFGANRDPAKFSSNFAPMQQQTCVACHKPQGASTDCLLCHNFHTGEWESQKPRSAVFREGK